MVSSPFTKEFEKYEIPEIELPARVLEIARKFNQEIVDHLQSKKTSQINSDISNGVFPTNVYNKLLCDSPKQPKATYNLYWVESSNEVIRALNITLLDLITLKNTPDLLPGSSFDRLVLHVRSFLNEFHRMKELINFYTKDYYRMGLITKNELNKHRDLYYSVFESLIKYRNEIHHNAVSWSGQDFIDLSLLEQLEGRSVAVLDTKSKKIFTKLNPLKKLCDGYLKSFSTTGKDMSGVVTNFIKFYDDILASGIEKESE